MIRLQLLGTVDLRDSQGRELGAVLRRPKLLALLGYLTVARPRGLQRRDTLVALLWPELDHAHARNALSQAVHALRQTLGHAALLARGEEELGVSEEAWGATCASSRRRSKLDGPSRHWSCTEAACSTGCTCRVFQSSSAGWTRSGSGCAGARAKPPSSSPSGRRGPAIRSGRPAGRCG